MTGEPVVPVDKVQQEVRSEVSAAWKEAQQLGEAVAMAVLRGGRQEIGTAVSVHDMGKIARAQVVNLPFFDDAGVRMHALDSDSAERD